MKKIMWIIYLVFLLNIASAIPPISQNFYGVALLSGSPAPIMTKIEAYYFDGENETICGDFEISESGKYGLLSCNGDDPDTPEIEGAVENQIIIFYMTTFNASIPNGTNWTGNISELTFAPVSINTTAYGNTSWNAGEFHQVNLYADFDMWWLNTTNNQTNVTNVTLPAGFCGDAICGTGEDCSTCTLDCGQCPPPPPGKGTGTGSKTKSSSQKSTSTSKPTPSNQPQQLLCLENWQCTDYSKCGPNEKKTRSCEDTSNCGTDKSKPKTEEACCFEEWKCGDWNECSVLGEQDRLCIDAKLCNTTEYKPNETQTCHYPTCSDGIKNGNEEGVDCGGICEACKGIEYSKPITAQPTFVARCGDNICNINEPCTCPSDCRKFPWIIIIIALVVSLIEHEWNKRRWKKIRNDIYVRKIDRLKKVAKIKRNSMWFKTIVMIASIILAVYIFYFATCPGGFRRYLAVLIIGAAATPVIAYFILKRFEYSEEEKELRYELLLETHKEQLEMLVEMENTEIRKVEQRLIVEIKNLNISGLDDVLKLKLDSIAYKLDMLSKFLKENEDYVDVESQLCADLEQIKEDESYKKMTENNLFKPLDSTLQILLTHHKDKQELLKNMAKDNERLKEEERKLGAENTENKTKDIKGQINTVKEELKQNATDSFNAEKQEEKSDLKKEDSLIKN